MSNPSSLSDKIAPNGEMLLRTLAMPADTNANGDIFGGWIMSQLDLAGGILAKEISKGRIATVSVSTITFKRPVSVGDIVCCHGKCSRIGNSSMSIELQVWNKKVLGDRAGERELVCEATFHYVAIDENGRPRQIQK
ncbi:acyl-CoA thioesterase [Vibrio sp. UCD-FRSSP16_10]|uniref:acyl-CoA thioester hydrolase YciA n=1 Tax=unclassified Vibrio TaxID=2614977 RepID=UPI0007FC65FB|nr:MULTISPECIES: acyl-CoA thioester hydrolase YciA [unclassified Vibrio]OBT13859.1 acyl-CoA thioesterase [Vibrio sp. UCD-FRSSP16_30]OBT22740.1 acyl-CoA thioesterase [Vibrio sp. UCD-FRSSP16_10]